MSSHVIESNSNADENGTNVDSEAQRNSLLTISSSSGGTSRNLAILLRDSSNWLPKIVSLQGTDVIILLTPIMIPISADPTDTSDPFEPLGRSLAERHPRIRHVPYRPRDGFTSTHLGFMKRGQVIILCLHLTPGQQIQNDFADIAFLASDNKPYIIVVCCNPIDSQLSIPFPTIIQAAGYTPAALEATAALIFSERPTAADHAETGVE